jgi:hypothetical protein
MGPPATLSSRSYAGTSVAGIRTDTLTEPGSRGYERISYRRQRAKGKAGDHPYCSLVLGEMA